MQLVHLFHKSVCRGQFVQCFCTYAGELISESADDAEDSGYHAERDDFVTDDDHAAAITSKGKAEVHNLL